ncbi:membrane protein insertion efficiency factor YidD [Riemerella columbina]|uniref:membrane protein insertion efficiency factor YidD n=1 Tax=Riemerella columbina TaxID=103810 RepID=UPI00036E226D|nr:membrane protein insertion efficiency factor YidD [Riemerella columbina]
MKATLNKILIFPLVIGIKFYQYALSPWLGKNCRFQPTCSHYMLQALKTHGLFKGLGLGIKRILRCHPWGGQGYDPVPPKHQKEK